VRKARLVPAVCTVCRSGLNLACKTGCPIEVVVVILIFYREGWCSCEGLELLTLGNPGRISSILLDILINIFGGFSVPPKTII
jgi:hypothetical protein